MMFNDTFDGKAEFVKAVADLLRKEPRCGVVDIRYERNFQNTNTEVIGIAYLGGHISKVNVTGDSNGAILKEIVAEVYGEGAFGRFKE
jgi:hypothetical protein